jgi:GNAT superfamily N-acetyltransferase
MALQIGVLVLLATVLYVLHKNFGRALWETLKKRLSKVAPGGNDDMKGDWVIPMIELSISHSRRSVSVNGIFTSGLSVDDVYLVLYPMEGIYPDFNVWFYDKIARRHESEERAVFIRHMHGRIAAVAIAKRSDAERKLCTLWVDPLRRGSGIAADLGERAFEWLGTRKPLFTIPEERMAEFRGLLNRWNFQKSQKLIGFYRAGKAEFVFNGQLCRGLRARTSSQAHHTNDRRPPFNRCKAYVATACDPPRMNPF